MQDRYAGDVGDFGKFALLRALSPGRRVGVCWYLSDGTHERNNDGRHLSYLDRPRRFRHLDIDLFDALAMYRADVLAGRLPRSVEALERLRLLPTTTRFHRTVCPAGTAARASWAREMVEAMGDADLVLLDPDNGLEGRDLTPKTVALEELKALRTGGRALLLYQHQTRRKGGASADIQAVVGRLQDSGFGAVQAIRFRPYSSRFYFLLDGFQELMQALGALASRWGDMVELH